MGEEELADLPQVVQDIVDVMPVEVLPVEALPVHAVTWFTRLLQFFAHHAYFLTFLGALVENTVILGFLLPGGAVVALAGAGGRTAGLSLPALVVLAAAGMCGGAVIDYYLGKAGITRLLHHRWMGRFGKRLAAQLEQSEPLLRRHGWWMMLVAHAFGTGRSSLAVAAGTSGLSLRRFMAMEVPAALLWSAVYAGGGYLLASQWSTFELILRRAGWVGTVGGAVAVLVWWLWRRSRPRDEATPPDDVVPKVYSPAVSAVGRGTPAAPEPAKTAQPAEPVR